MSHDFSESKKPLLNYSENLERADLFEDGNDERSMPPRKRKSKKSKKGGVKRKSGVRFVKGRLVVNGVKYASSDVVKQIANSVIQKAANKISKKGKKKSRKGRKKKRSR